MSERQNDGMTKGLHVTLIYYPWPFYGGGIKKSEFEVLSSFKRILDDLSYISILSTPPPFNILISNYMCGKSQSGRIPYTCTYNIEIGEFSDMSAGVYLLPTF
jgi:hypothetical protein